ncbi:Na+/H+ antiporter NhaA [Parafrankia sp. BMG5.11]|uniref:Na+/H+ antiporter NhaA n=1 Tax=Parafrankia sp. BMG5.11 TaxID=222540 RepID=UPI001FB300D1|nr:Na+/H+ antiporter NhaA [Parafrankia sp. BMG5.11]
MSAAPSGTPTPEGRGRSGALPTRLLTRPGWFRAQQVTGVLRSETVGGLLLLAGAVVALVWANSPWRAAYATLTGAYVGPEALHLRLNLAHWASDGLLAIFFFVVGLELKREFVLGELRSPSRAALPIIAAVGGMAMPALIYTLVNSLSADGAPEGWAVPTATDIAFAVAVLAIISTHLPVALRSFLLTLAVVDDLLAITIIAVFFTDSLSPAPLAGSVATIILFTLLVNRGAGRWWLLLPLAVVAWALMHASGVHATIAGVLMGFAVPARPEPGERVGMSERLEHLWRPVSAGIAVPIFALMAAGVSLGDGGIGAALRDPAGMGIALGLVVGKLVGVLGSTFLLARFTHAELDQSLSWWDVLGVALLAGVGFTVSLLIGELAFGDGTERNDHAKAAILLGSLTSALLAAVVLRTRNRVYRKIEEEETIDQDGDGIPDVFQESAVEDAASHATDTPRRG